MTSACVSEVFVTRMNKVVIRWNSAYYGVEVQIDRKRFVISGMPNMVGRLDAAVKCCETMGNWRLPVFGEMDLIAANLQQINAVMQQNGGHRMDKESVLWLNGDYGHSTALKRDEGLCYILQLRKDTLSEWWCRREIRLVMSL